MQNIYASMCAYMSKNVQIYVYEYAFYIDKMPK
jgi:hypothetical protein